MRINKDTKVEEVTKKTKDGLNNLCDIKLLIERLGYRDMSGKSLLTPQYSLCKSVQWISSSPSRIKSLPGLIDYVFAFTNS